MTTEKNSTNGADVTMTSANGTVENQPVQRSTVRYIPSANRELTIRLAQQDYARRCRLERLLGQH